MSDGTPNVEVFRLAKLIGNVLIYLFGSPILIWACFGILAPILLAFFGSNTDYTRYIHSLALKEAAQAGVYEWIAPGDPLSAASTTARGLVKPVDRVASSTHGVERSSATDRAIKGFYDKLDNFTSYIESDWKYLQVDLLTIALLRLYAILPLFAAAIPVWIGFFFAGEYTARKRFEESFQPSSNRTKYWFQYVRFLPATALALPTIAAPFPALPVFLGAVMFTCYAIYKMRSESMEFV